MHASLVARESKGAWSYATVWRVTDQAGIELTAGPQDPWAGRCRSSCGRVKQAVEEHPEAKQLDLARQIGVSRSTVGRAVRA
jgi:hypothetical protein